MVLYRSAESNIMFEGPGRLRMASEDGLTVKCWRNEELIKEVATTKLCGRNSRFNGLGIGKLSAPVRDRKTTN